MIHHYPNDEDLSYFEEQIAQNQPELYATKKLDLQRRLKAHKKELSQDFHLKFIQISDSLSAMGYDSIPLIKVDSILIAKGGIIDVQYKVRFGLPGEEYLLLFNGTEADGKWIIGDQLEIKKQAFELCQCKNFKELPQKEKADCEKHLRTLSENRNTDFLEILDELQNCP